MITSCPICNKPIPDKVYFQHAVVVASTYETPTQEYCTECGNPIQWINKKDELELKPINEEPIEILKRIFSHFYSQRIETESQ